MPAPIDLVSPHPPDECARRLREKSDRAGVFSGRNPVVGHVDETTLRLRKRIRYRNSFQIRLVATLVAEGGRTRLRCRFGLHPAVRAFMVLWFSAVVVIGGSMVIGALRDGLGSGSAREDQIVLLAAPVMMLCAGVALVVFGRYLARDEKRFLLDFLRDTLDARGTSARPG